MKEQARWEILVVDDNDSDAELTRIALSKCNINCQIHRVYDGVEALEFIHSADIHPEEERQRLPDLILLDFKIPKMNGLEVLSQLKNNEITKNIPVVILTTTKQPCDIQLFFNHGASWYIEKSFYPNRFFQDVEKMCKKWLPDL